MNTNGIAGARKGVMYKIGVSAVTLALFAGAAGTYAAFTATTINTGNSVTSGTVDIDQHGSAVAVISASGLRPTTTVEAGGTGAKERCIRVTYSGSLEASVRFYISSGAFTNGDRYTLKVERGTGLTTLNGTMSCAGWALGSEAFAAANLDTFPTTWAAGVTGKAAAAAWATSDTVDYKFTISANDDTTVNAHEQSPLEDFPTGSFSITWEARNTN